MRGMKNWKKDLPKFIVIAIGASLFLYFYISGKIIRHNFYIAKTNARIIDSSDWKVRTIDYILKDGLQLSAPAHPSESQIRINVGDSITKEANSWNFKVFKKSELLAYEYDYQHNLLRLKFFK